MAKTSGVNSSIRLLTAVCLVLFVTPSHGISCPDAITKLIPCQPFLMGSGAISVSCCDGIKALQRFASSKSNRIPICLCFKQVVSSGISNSIVEKAKLIPHLCQVNFPLVIDPTTNCAKFGFLAHESLDWNRYKDMKETSPGRSPGIGHGSPPPRGEKLH